LEADAQWAMKNVNEQMAAEKRLKALEEQVEESWV